MSVKTQRKAKAETASDKVSTKARSSASKTVFRFNGKHSLTAYEHLHIGIVQSSLNGEYIDANEEFCRILGYSKKELLQLNLKDCTHEEDYAIDLKLHEQLVAGKIPFYGLEKRLVRKDGQIIWVELTRSLVRDVDGKPLHTMGVVIDISEYKKVERVLRESAENLRLATEAARMFKWELDFQKQLYTFSDNFSRVLGFSAGLLPQNPAEAVWKLSPEEDVRVISEAIASAIQNRSDLHSLQYRMIDPENGQTVWLEANAKVVYDRQGNALRMFGVAQNITESKKAEEEIRILSKLPSENPNPVMRLTAEGNVLYANDASGLLLESWEEKNDQTSLAELKKSAGESFASGSKKQIELEHGGKVFSGTLAPIRDAGYINFYGSDITERKRAEHALAEHARQQAALYQLSDQLHHAHSLEEVYSAALKAILTGLQCDRASILLFDDSGVVRFVAWQGLSDEYRQATEGHSPWNSAEKNPYPICVSDIPKSDLSDSLKATIQKEGIGSLVFIPLMSNGKLIGKFMMYFDVPHDCDDIEIELGLMIARQLAFGIDRRRADEALRASEERYRGIVNQTIGGIAETDLTGRFVMVNDHFCKITGYPRAKLLNAMHMQDITHPDDLQKNLGLFERLATDGTSFEIEKRYIRPDGSTVWVHNSVSAITSADGKPHSAVAVVIDVTERKQAEEQLRKSAEFDAFRLALTDALRPLSDPKKILAEAMRVLGERLQVDRVLYSEIGDDNETIQILDNYVKDGIPRLTGRASLNDYGKTRGRLNAGQNLVITDAAVSPDMDEKDRDSFAALGIESGLAIPLVKNGRWTATLGVHHGSARAWTKNEIKFVEETAERTWSALEHARAQEKLRASETLYRTIARSIPGGGVYVVDKDFRYLVAEGPVTEAFGFSRDQIEGHTVSEALSSEAGARMEERLQRNFAGETLSFETTHEGRVYWTQQAPLLDSIGQAIILTVDITERKQAEEALRIENERFMRFVNSNIVGILIGDAEGRVILANDYYLHLLGVSRQEFSDGNVDWKRFTPPEWLLADEKAIQQLREHGVCEPYEKEYLRTDGTRVPVYIADAMLPGPGAEIAAFVLDITERKRAEEALRESEERLSVLLRQATAGIVRKDAAGRFTFVNEAFCEMLGYSESELLGKTVWDFMHQEDIAENKRSFDRLMIQAMPFKLERRFLRKDGSIIWVDASVSPVMDAEGKPQSAVAVEVDITGRKQAEAELQQLNLQLESRVQKRTTTIQAINQSLREEIAERKRMEEALRLSEAAARASEEKLRTLFDLLPVGISFLDPDGNIIQMNSALPAILRLTKEQLASQSYRSRKYIHVDGRPMLPDEFASARALKENRTIYNVETGILLESGEVIWTSVSASPVDVADVGVVVVTVDTTESKHAERALQESHGRLRVLSRRLVEVQEEERRALARELHDRVGQTLAALNINLIIMNSQLSSEVAQLIGARLNDSMKLVAETIALVRDVMTDLRPAVLDDYGLEAALEAHLSGFKSRYNLQIDFRKSAHSLPRLGPSLEMTFLRIAQEALMNVAKHAHAEHIHLSLREEGETICLSIQDDGIGMESWSDATRPGSHGLTIMRERAEAFGGTLQVRSLPGQGTTVEASIPFRKTETL